MTDEEILKAVREAILMEKEAYEFYRCRAALTENTEARRILERLAQDEKEHAAMFYSIYPGIDLPPFEELIDDAVPVEGDGGWGDPTGLDECGALRVALRREEAIEQKLRAMAREVHDPGLKGIYESNAAATRRHAELIRREYLAHCAAEE